MTVIAFDTLAYAKKLEEKGFSEQQAEALVELQKEIFQEALESQLATKSDSWEIKSEQKLHRWMIGFNLAFTVAIVYKLFFVS